MKALLALVLAAAAGAAAVGAASSRAEDDPAAGMARYWVGLIHKGPGWTAGGSEETNALMRGHLERIGQLVASGELVLAGPFEGGGDLRGLFVYAVETEEQARALADSDPAVSAGRLRVELLPWWGPASLKALHADLAAHPEGDPRETGRAPAGDGGQEGGDDGSAQAPRERLADTLVEAACGQCQLGLPGDDCQLAVRFDGRALFVVGASIDGHGDAHAADGFCNTVRQARVSGHVQDGRFVVTAFALVADDG